MFVHVCEAFLGIEPHFEFFRALYKLVPLPFSERMGRVGCAHLELQVKLVGEYLVWPKIGLSPQWPNDCLILGILLLVFLDLALSQSSG